MKTGLEKLEDCFESAYRVNAPFVGVRVRFAGQIADEYIINPNANIISKLRYYKEAYDKNLRLKSNEKISIVSFAYGNTFDEVKNGL